MFIDPHRYGTPPDYVSIPLRGELSSAQPVLLDINDHETVWIDVCPKCRGDEYCIVGRESMHSYSRDIMISPLYIQRRRREHGCVAPILALQSPLPQGQ